MTSPMNTGAEFSSIGASAPLPPPRRLNRPAWTVPVQAGRTISGSAPPPSLSRLFVCAQTEDPRRKNTTHACEARSVVSPKSRACPKSMNPFARARDQSVMERGRTPLGQSGRIES